LIFPFIYPANQKNLTLISLSPPFSNFLSLDNSFPEPLLIHPEIVESSLHVFENPLYNLQVSSPRVSMATVEGGGGGGLGAGGGGGCGHNPPPPPRIFTKVAAKHAPLVLPTPLDTLPKN